MSAPRYYDPQYVTTVARVYHTNHVTTVTTVTMVGMFISFRYKSPNQTSLPKSSKHSNCSNQTYVPIRDNCSERSNHNNCSNRSRNTDYTFFMSLGGNEIPTNECYLSYVVHWYPLFIKH